MNRVRENEALAILCAHNNQNDLLLEAGRKTSHDNITATIVPQGVRAIRFSYDHVIFKYMVLNTRIYSTWNKWDKWSSDMYFNEWYQYVHIW